ncbi:hypothetical protein Aargi30884_17290 [Amedibacterium intestinale]|uniref:HPr kinase n=1 Tax=Amedibacterium intestinale TaxID=2583452 RepID=A0A6N4THY2_9FIRM|nr:hypothetical protein [Amedibacterium intestinale]BBK22826.1 hypothetical protein Aargi30884_17290 [Amedibacterium intestinale]
MWKLLDKKLELISITKNVYEYGDYNIIINYNSHSIFLSLMNILKSHFKETNYNKEILFTYNIVLDNEIFEDLEHIFSYSRKEDVVLSYCRTEKGTMRAEKVVLNDKGQYLLKTTKTNTFLIADDNKRSYFFVVNETYLDRNTVNKDNYLFFEHILCKSFVEKDYVLLHAAAVKFREKTILIIGEKRSGKTTLMFELTKKHSMHPLAVDKVLCKFTETGKIEVLGVPSRIRVLAGTLSKYKDYFYNLIPKKYLNASEKDLWAGKSDGKIDLSLSEFEKFIDNKFCEQGTLTTIIFPNIKQQMQPQLYDMESDSVISKIKSCIYSPICPEEDYWSTIGKKQIVSLNINTITLSNSIINNYLSFELVGNSDLSKPVGNLIKKLSNM